MQLFSLEIIPHSGHILLKYGINNSVYIDENYLYFKTAFLKLRLKMIRVGSLGKNKINQGDFYIMFIIGTNYVGAYYKHLSLKLHNKYDMLAIFKNYYYEY